MIAEPFPVPDSRSLAVSAALVEKIGQAIDGAGGWLGFADFMQLALHEPGLGYYSAGAVKLGRAGDFTTAPEISDWLAAALAPFIDAVLAELDANRVIELGAGSGRLAEQLLARLGDDGPDIDYAILETSADLRERQRQHLRAAGRKTSWLETMPADGFRGVILANEVADALPVMRFEKTRDAVLPLGVVRDGEGLAIVPGPTDDQLSDAVARIESALGVPLPVGYRSEACLWLRPWLHGLLGSIEDGGLLLIDYGMPRRDYYRSERTDGTLACHFRHRVHADPLLWPGLQDLTAWVDFTAVAEVARELGFLVAGFTTQAQFLIESIARHPVLSKQSISPREASAMKTLLLPGEMGERFKLMWLTRDRIAATVPGRDFRDWL